MKSPTTALAVILACVSGSTAWGQDKSVRPGINKDFEDPDVAAYVKRFEVESREVFALREAIVGAMGLRPGMAAADVGAGTGLFTRPMADRVGPRGKVYAVDIAPAFLKHIAAEAKRSGQEQVVTVLASADSSNLPAGSIDLAFLCDTYHHLEFPSKTLASLHRALRPDGRLIVIDFDRREGISSPFVLEHVRAGKEAFTSEIEAAGFDRIATEGAPALKENFFAAFRKGKTPAGARNPDPGGR